MSTPTSSVPVDLRPLKLGELVDRAAAMWRQNFGTFFRLYLAIEFVGFIVAKAYEIFLARYAPLMRGGAKLMEAAQNQSGELLQQYAIAGVGLVVFAVVAMALAWIASFIGSDFAVRRQLGQPATLSDSVARFRSRWGKVMGASVIAALYGVLALIVVSIPGVALTVVGGVIAASGSAAGGFAVAVLGGALWLFGFLVAFVWWILRFMVTAPVMAMEDVTAWRAITRSGALVSGRVGSGFMNLVKVRATVLLTLAYLIVLIVTFIFGIPALFVQFAYANPLDVAHADPDAIPQVLLIPAQLLQVLGQSALTPLVAIVSALFYVDMRVRREGLDLELKMAGSQNP